MIPMQEPANMPLEVMCHVEERKHASMVYQFQSICQGARERKSFSREKTGKLKAKSDETWCCTEILHCAEPPMAMPDMRVPDAVAVVLDIGLVGVLVAMLMAIEVVIVSIISTSTMQTR